MDDLKALLGQLREGGQVESSGRFTLDLRKAREKLRQYQLAEPCFYLLKLVQAGVSARAQRIDMRLVRRDVHVYMSLPPGTALAESAPLLEHLQDPQSAGAGPLRHLAIGLNASWALEPESVTWTYWPGHSGRGWSLRIDAGEIQLQPAGPRTFKSPDGLDLVEFSLTRDASITSFVRNAASEHTSVIYRCGFCPVPLFINDRRLVGQWSRPEIGPDWMGAPYLVAERFLCSTEGLRLCAPPWSKLKPAGVGTLINVKEASGDTTTRYPSFAYQFVGTGPLKKSDTVLCSCALAMPMHFSGDSIMVIVKDGVTLEPISLIGPVLGGKGIQALIAAPNAPTDLSEFRAIDGEEEVAVCKRLVLEQVRAMADQLLPLAPRVLHQRMAGQSDEVDDEWFYQLAARIFFSESYAPRKQMRQRLRDHVRTNLLRLGSG